MGVAFYPKGKTRCDLQSRYVHYRKKNITNIISFWFNFDFNMKNNYSGNKRALGCFYLEIKHSEEVTRGCFCKIKLYLLKFKLFDCEIMSSFSLEDNVFQLDMAGALLFFMTTSVCVDRW